MVLMEHPAVAQAVTFAVPHVRLGEDIAAAVVLHHNATATEQELRRFVATRLADFKVPRQVLLVPEIPKGSTGKLQRRSLASTFRLDRTRPGTARQRYQFRDSTHADGRALGRDLDPDMRGREREHPRRLLPVGGRLPDGHTAPVTPPRGCAR